MPVIHLFVQEGCTGCSYAETELKKVGGWDSVVTITNAKENGVLSDFAVEFGIENTPTLIVLTDGNVVVEESASAAMTSDFWKEIVSKYGG